MDLINKALILVAVFELGCVIWWIDSKIDVWLFEREAKKRLASFN